MISDPAADTRSYYTIAIVALAVVVLANVATRDWLGLGSGLCLLCAFLLLRAGAPNNSVVGRAAYYALILGVFAFVTMSWLAT